MTTKNCLSHLILLYQFVMHQNICFSDTFFIGDQSTKFTIERIKNRFFSSPIFSRL